VVALLLTTLGSVQAHVRYHDWPDARAVVADLRPQIGDGNGRYLVESSPVFLYYLAGQTDPRGWTNTSYFHYRTPSGQDLLGVPAYAAAISDRHFDVIALRSGVVATDLDTRLGDLVRAQPGYELVRSLPSVNSFGRGEWLVWRLRTTG
jgi:hypothetical protein